MKSIVYFLTAAAVLTLLFPMPLTVSYIVRTVIFLVCIFSLFTLTANSHLPQEKRRKVDTMSWPKPVMLAFLVLFNPIYHFTLSSEIYIGIYIAFSAVCIIFGFTEKGR